MPVQVRIIIAENDLGENCQKHSGLKIYGPLVEIVNKGYI